MMAEAAARARASLDEITPEEDAAITAAALLDPDNPPWFEDAAGVPSFIEIDADVATRLKMDGPDWRERANRMLRDALGL